MSGLIITAGEAGFHHFEEGGDTIRFVDVFGWRSTFLGGRFHFDASTAGWMAEASFLSDDYRTVLTGTAVVDLEEAGLGEGDRLLFTGVDYASLRDGVMTDVGSMAVQRGAAAATVFYTSAIYIDEAPNAWSLVVDAGASLAQIAAQRGVTFNGSDAVDLFDDYQWFIEFRGFTMRRGLQAEGGGGDDVIFGTSLSDRIFGGDDNDRVYGGDSGRDRLFGGNGDGRSPCHLAGFTGRGGSSDCSGRTHPRPQLPDVGHCVMTQASERGLPFRAMQRRSDPGPTGRARGRAALPFG